MLKIAQVLTIAYIGLLLIVLFNDYSLKTKSYTDKAYQSGLKLPSAAAEASPSEQ